MGIFCIPWSILIIYILGCIGVPVAIELVLHTKWWKNYRIIITLLMKRRRKNRKGEAYET